MPTDQDFRNKAKQYAESSLYQQSVSAKVDKMSKTNGDTRVGLIVTPTQGSTLGGILGAILGLLCGGVMGLFLLIAIPNILVLGIVGVGGGWIGWQFGQNLSNNSEFVTVTMNDNLDVVLSNTNLSEGDYYDHLDLQVSADAKRAKRETSGSIEALRQYQLQQEIIDSWFGFSVNSGAQSPPDRCPNCDESGSWGQPQFEEFADGQFQCRNTDCNYVYDARRAD